MKREGKMRNRGSGAAVQGMRQQETGKLEVSLDAVGDFLEIAGNYLVVLCLFTVAGTLFHTLDTPLWYQLFPFLLPCVFWAMRRYVRRIGLFFAGHLLFCALIVWLGRQGEPPLFWMIAFGAAAVIYTVHSFRVRISERTDEAVPAGMAAIIGALSYFACLYLKSEIACNRILSLELIYILIWFLRKYFEHFVNFLISNRSSGGRMPSRSIFRSGLVAVGGCSLALVGALTALVRTPLLDWLTDVAKRIGFAVMRGLVSLLAPKGGVAAADPEIAADPAPSPGGGLPFAMEATETPLWMKAVEIVLDICIAVALLAGAVTVIVLLVRFVVNAFYSRSGDRQPRRYQEEGILEEEEHLPRSEKARRERTAPKFGFKPALRIRRSFWKTASGASERRKAGEVPPGTTAREWAAQLSGGEDAEEWGKLTELYERARYGNREMTSQDARQAQALARKIRG